MVSLLMQTIVGVNSWVEHRSKEVFGEDADQFVPERWLTDDKERLSLMNSHWMPVCLHNPLEPRRVVNLVLIPLLVRARLPYLSWAAYLNVGDINADPSAITRLRDGALRRDQSTREFVGNYESLVCETAELFGQGQGATIASARQAGDLNHRFSHTWLRQIP